MGKLQDNAITAIIAGIVVGLVHGGAHLYFGMESSFVAAGVTPVGITVTIATMIVTFIILQRR